MTSSKRHKNMDKTSAAMTTALNKRREDNKLKRKRHEQRRRDKTSLFRGY